MASDHRSRTITLIAGALALAATVATACSSDAPAPALAETTSAIRGARWTTAAPIPQGRAGHTMFPTPDGRVLVAGGVIGLTPLLATPVYDVATDAWSPSGGLSHGRVFHAAARLADGRVLVAGGQLTEVGLLKNAELGDPIAGTWTSIDDMSQSRTSATATELLDGRVLVAGGATPSIHASTEIYDLVARSWQPGPPMLQPHVGHTATRLLDGRVLVAGGSTGPSAAGAEVFDPKAGTWTATGPMSGIRSLHTATLLADGRVLLTGGLTNQALKTTDIFDPATGSWSPAASMASRRALHAAVRLPDGRVLVSGGIATIKPDEAGYVPALATSEVYDPATNTWSDAGLMTTPRAFHDASVLGTGQILVTGGVVAVLIQGGALAIENVKVTSSSEVFTPYLRVQGDPCTIGSQCETGFCADGVCCDTPCETGGCTACSKEKGAKVQGTCMALALPGCSVKPCKAGSDCETGFCADGVCCDSACDGPCRSCLLVPGTCTLAPDATDPRRDCHAGADACVATCDGAGACRPAEVGSRCVPAGCADETHAIVPGTCAQIDLPECAPLPDGNVPEGCLGCVDQGTTQNCAPYRCDTEVGACIDRCRSVHDCAAGRVCDPEGRCIPPPPVEVQDEAGCSAGSGAPSGSGGAWIVTALAIAASLGRRTRRAAATSARGCTGRRGTLRPTGSRSAGSTAGTSRS